jgi:hypothetical protein
MLSDERRGALGAKARSRARVKSDAALLAAAAKAERLRDYVRSGDARAVFAVLAEVYRAEIERRRTNKKIV